MTAPDRSLTERDALVSWHPYTQHGFETARMSVAGASGARLELTDGRRVLDAISSWWAVLHGHAEPRLIEAMVRQAQRLDHVLFAGATHEPAVALPEALVAATPGALSRAFFSDDGSTAVEEALKMAWQSALQRGEPQRTVFVALEGAYHGDTFGAMSIGDPDPFFRMFEPLLFSVKRVPADAAAIAATLDELGERALALILEPLVQGAARMRMHSSEVVRAARAACDRNGALLIADEVMTGFGRTGALFACERAGIAPDLMCLAKGLTGGFFPLSATLATEAIFEAFLSTDRRRALFHGHTFTAHPVGCAIALESLALCRERNVPARLDAIGAGIEGALRETLPAGAPVHDVRRTGGIVALDLAVDEGSSYFASIGPRLRERAIERGFLLRPLGSVLYAMPPACTTDTEARTIGVAMAELACEAAG